MSTPALCEDHERCSSRPASSGGLGHVICDRGSAVIAVARHISLLPPKSADSRGHDKGIGLLIPSQVTAKWPTAPPFRVSLRSECAEAQVRLSQDGNEPETAFGRSEDGWPLCAHGGTDGGLRMRLDVALRRAAVLLTP